MQLSTGFIYAAGYAIKIRRVLFAQLRDQLKAGTVTSQEIARASGELNSFLYRVIVDKLKTDKRDVIRIKVEYELQNGKIIWKYDTISIEIYKKMAEEKIAEAVSETPTEATVVERVRETPLGDVIYRVKRGDETIGLIVATPADSEVVIRGVLTDPPRKFEKVVFSGKMEHFEEMMQERLEELMEKGEPIELEEAKQILMQFLGKYGN